MTEASSDALKALTERKDKRRIIKLTCSYILPPPLQGKENSTTSYEGVNSLHASQVSLLAVAGRCQWRQQLAIKRPNF